MYWNQYISLIMKSASLLNLIFCGTKLWYNMMGFLWLLNCVCTFLLYQDITNGLDALATVICMIVWNLHPTLVRVIRMSSSTKPYSRVTPTASKDLVTNYTDSCFGWISLRRTHSVEPLPVTEMLQRAFRSKKRLPHVTAQWGGAVLPVSNKRI